MATLGLYETVCYAPDGSFGVRIQAVSASGLVDDAARQTPDALLTCLGLKFVGKPPEPSSPLYLPYAIVSVLVQDTGTAAEKLFNELRELPPAQAFEKIPVQAKALAEEVAFATPIPFEQSPWAMRTIAEIIGTVRGPNQAQVIGALIGVGVATATLPPSALIWVPAGIIAVTASWAVAKYIQWRIAQARKIKVGSLDLRKLEDESRKIPSFAPKNKSIGGVMV
jgi:hypothetical protein